MMRSKMPSGFTAGIKQFIPTNFRKKNELLKVLSIGCGSNPDIIYNEFGALYLHFNRAPIEYWGVDINFKSEVTSLQSKLNEKLKADGISQPYFNLLQLNASSAAELNPILTKRFDIVLLRHPQFFDEFEKSTRVIIRSSIPKILKLQGLLIVSLYTDNECFYFKPHAGNYDHVMLNCLYSPKGYRANPLETAAPTRRGQIGGIEACEDKHMYCFVNRVNTQDEQPECISIFEEIWSTHSTLIRGFFAALNIGFNSKNDTIMFWPAYWHAFLAYIETKLSSTTALSTAPQAFFGSSDSTAAQNKNGETAISIATENKHPLLKELQLFNTDANPTEPCVKPVEYTHQTLPSSP